MPRELPWTGERMVPQVDGDTAIEHLHRYALARELAVGTSVLDIACGAGYGAYLMAGVADTVVGVDISTEAIAYARGAYPRANLRFETGSCTEIPSPDGAFGLVVSFETIEHITDHEKMLQEVKRVLQPGGKLMISTPDRRVYSDLTGYKNPFHVRELYLEEFRELLGKYFSYVQLYGQRLFMGSLAGPIGHPGSHDFQTYSGNFTEIDKRPGLPEAVYLVAVASDATVELALQQTVFIPGKGLRNSREVACEEADVFRQRVAAMESSMSWRLTRPLRALGDYVQKWYR